MNPTHITSFYLNWLFKGPPTNGILMGHLGLNLYIFKEHNSAHTQKNL